MNYAEMHSTLVTLHPLIIGLLLWSLVWKGLAMWHSARRKEPVWFVIFIFVQTMGILEIIYLFGVAKLKTSDLFKNK